jgi:hypothetical protein
MVLVCVLVISFTLGLAGFSLANPEAAKSLQEDRLVGVFITTEYLDLFDFEKYLNDNMGSFGGGEIRMDGETAEYQGRLYAALKERSMKNEENGELVTTKEYVFEEVEGFVFYYTITDGQEPIAQPAAAKGYQTDTSAFPKRTGEWKLFWKAPSMSRRLPATSIT